MKPQDLLIRTLGECRIDSPIRGLLGKPDEEMLPFDQDDRVLFDARLKAGSPRRIDTASVPTFEPAIPRERIFYDPAHTRVGIVTCGGLCPGINDVIRGLVMTLFYRYGVKSIFGFRYGFAGFIPALEHQPLALDPERVSNIHQLGGTVLGSSRGAQDVSEIVDCLQDRKINILFVIGGDGTQRGALAISEQITQRGMPIAVIGVPKTIDNDILFVEPSFGFQTAYSESVDSLSSAHTEAKGVPYGVGLVKLMGRNSGFIASYATVASGDVNFTLIPEVPFSLPKFLDALHERLTRRRHAVVVVAEGAGQHLFENATRSYDKSGNIIHHDIGLHLKAAIEDHGRTTGMDIGVKYIDPSYLIRSIPAHAQDSVYCLRLAQCAVHAAMAGRTEAVVGHWHSHFVLVPMAMVCQGQKRVDPEGDLWHSVLEATGQPVGIHTAD